jgi:anaerobic magnesium-protoporphyrin IX monomethyl ester cyclase
MYGQPGPGKKKCSMKVAIIQVTNPNNRSAVNKDLNGGFGTRDHYGDSFFSRLLMLVKKKAVRLPVIGLAHLQAILKEKGSTVKYFEEDLPGGNENFDLVLVYGSIVDYTFENQQAILLKQRFPAARVGFIGPFPSQCPELFTTGDFVLIGEPEAFFMNEFTALQQLNGNVKVSSLTNMEALPAPDFDGFPISKYTYRPLINKRPFLVLQASKGCPYSCRFYCVYGEAQGPKIRQRSARKVVDDIEVLQEKYGIKGIQFRDPLFGVNKQFLAEFVEEMKERNVKLTWGMETRLDLLNEENLLAMYSVGLRNINVGIETFDESVAKANRRLLVEESHQDKIVRFCKKKGINVSAFYVLAMEGDTEETMENTLRHAIGLNTLTARFSISTPYPGTGYFQQLRNDKRLLTEEYESYDQFTLVYKQENLSPHQVNHFMDRAYRKYYFRPSYIFMFLKWRIRSFLSNA